MSVDYSQLEAFKKNVEKYKNEQVDQFMISCSKELAARLLTKVVKRTPVDSGYLRRGWTAGTKQSPPKYVDSLTIVRNGRSYEITISNSVEYSVYIEYGHRVKKKDGWGWVEGHRMLSIPVDEIKASSQEILEKKLQKFMKEVFRN